jgi:hypothetical protein
LRNIVVQIHKQKYYIYWIFIVQNVFFLCFWIWPLSRFIICWQHVHCSLPSNYTLMIICFICGVLVSWFVLVSCLIVISNFWIVMLLFVVPFVLMQGSLHASLVEVVRAHKMLRTSPYCKRIFSKTQFKKWCSNKTTTTTTITICCCVCVFRIYAQSSLLINLGKVFMLIYNMWLEWIVFIKFVLVCVVFYMIFYLDAWFIFMSWDLSDIILYLNFFFQINIMLFFQVSDATNW